MSRRVTFREINNISMRYWRNIVAKFWRLRLLVTSVFIVRQHSMHAERDIVLPVLSVCYYYYYYFIFFYPR